MPHPRAIARALPGLLLLAAACGRSAPAREGDVGARGRDSLPQVAARGDSGAGRPHWSFGEPQWVASLQTVRNPDAPLLGPDQVRVEMVWSKQLQHGVAPLGHVLAVQPPWVHVLHGGEIQTFGLNPGPSEYFYIPDSATAATSTSLTAAGDRLVVGDSARGTATLISPSGAAARVQIGDNPYLQGLENGDFVANSFGGTTLGWQRRGPRGSRREVFQLPLPPQDAQHALCPVVTGGRWLLVAACAYPAFRVVSTDGVLLREVRIDRGNVDTTTASPAPPGFVPAEWPRRSSDLRQEGYLPHPNLGVHFDPRSGLFAMVWHNPASPETRVELFTAEGVYLAGLRFRGAWIDFGFWNSTLYALTYDSASRWPQLSAYRIRLPPLPGAAQAR